MAKCTCGYLPTRLEYSLFGGQERKYKEALYLKFKADIAQGLSFHGRPVDIIHESYFEGKERTFWHIISKGDKDENRAIDVERCASLPWIKPLILGDESCPNYRFWVKWHDKTNRYRYYIWCSKVNYMVILEDRKSHFKLITAYNVEDYNIRTYEKEYHKYIETKTPT